MLTFSGGSAETDDSISQMKTRLGKHFQWGEPKVKHSHLSRSFTHFSLQNISQKILRIKVCITPEVVQSD